MKSAPRAMAVVVVLATACALLGSGAAHAGSPAAPAHHAPRSHPRAAAHALARDLRRTSVAPGISVWTERWRARDGSPQRSSLLSVDLTDRRVGASVVSAHGVTNGGYQQVRTMMASTGAVAGINGDFFDLGTSTGQTVGGIVHAGAIWRTPRPGFNANLYLRADGSAGIGPVTVAGSITTSVTTGRTTRHLTHGLVSVNKLRDAAGGRITLVTHAMAGTSLPPSCTVVSGKVTKGVFPTGATVSVTGVVRRTVRHSFLPQLPAGTVALVGCGWSSAWLTTALPVARTAVITVGFTGLRPTALVSGAQVLVQNGRAYSDPRAHVITDRHAETFACVSRDARHLLLGTVDMYWENWQTEWGVTMSLLRSYLLGKNTASKPCWTAMALDGGGSSTLDYRRTGTTKVVTVNHPADGDERHIPDALLFYTKR